MTCKSLWLCVVRLVCWLVRSFVWPVPCLDWWLSYTQNETSHRLACNMTLCVHYVSWTIKFISISFLFLTFANWTSHNTQRSQSLATYVSVITITTTWLRTGGVGGQHGTERNESSGFITDSIYLSNMIVKFLSQREIPGAFKTALQFSSLSSPLGKY